MARLSFILLAIVAAVFLVDSASSHRCGKHEHWSNCGSSCPPTCDRPNPGICTTRCHVGCECKPGFLRNRHGHCVRRNHC